MMPSSPPPRRFSATFRYEVRATLTSIPLVVAMVVIILLSFAVIQGLAPSPSTNTVTDQYSGLSYTEGSQAHFAIYAYTSLGDPLPGVSFVVSFFDQDQYGNPNGSAVANLSMSTDASGVAGGAASPSDWNRTGSWAVVGNFSDPHRSDLGGSGGHTEPIQFGFNHMPPGEVQPLGQLGDLNFNPFGAVVARSPSTAPNDLSAFYLGPNGTNPSGDALRFFVWNSTSRNPTPMPENETALVGNFTAPVGRFAFVIPSSLLAGSSPQLFFEIFTPAGHVLGMFNAGLSPSQFEPATAPTAANVVVIEFVGAILAIFVPLMAILAAYSGYGSDRVSGTIESVLAQPVSRWGLVLSRYLAVLVALAVALAIAAGVVDGLVHFYTGSFLPGVEISALFISLFLIGAAFASLVFLLSYVARSAGAALGASVGIFMLFAFFWTQIVIPLVAQYTGNPGGSPGYYTWAFRLEYASPAGAVSLAQALLINSFVQLGMVGSVDPGAYGVSWLTVGAVAIAWIVVPLVLLFYLVKTRD
ncbi:MAG: ABC transporter permease subunit [Thermoplasmata archaeon]